VRQFGIDIWLTSHACIYGARICQAFMDAPKIHNPKDPGTSLDGMFRDVIQVAFGTLVAHADAWLPLESTAPSMMFGFGMGARERPEAVTVETGPLHRRFIDAFGTRSAGTSYGTRCGAIRSRCASPTSSGAGSSTT